MTGWSDAAIWGIIVALGIGTWLIRFSFLGLIGDRELPAWVLRHLRYTPVAVIPALIAPLVLWPEATGGQPDPARLSAVAACIVVGLWTRNMVASILAGMGTLLALQALL